MKYRQCIQETFSEIRYLKGGSQKFYFCFGTQPFFMKIITKNNRNLELVTSPFWGCQIYSEVFFLQWSFNWPFLSFNSKRFLSYSKNYHWLFMQAISWCQIIPFSTSSLNLKTLGKKKESDKHLNKSITKRAF